MKFMSKFAVLMILAAMQFPNVVQAADEDKELAPIAAEQPQSDEELGDINPALTEKISTKQQQESEKDKKKRKKKLERTRKEKEDANERKLKESDKSKKDKKSKNKSDEGIIIIDPNEPELVPQPVTTPKPEPAPQQIQPTPQPVTPKPAIQPPPTTDTVKLPDQQTIYANFAEVARAVNFVPLYMPRKSGYEITALYASNGVAEVRYGRRWEPTVSLTIRTHRRAEGEALQDISGVTGVKWRIDNSTGTTIYIAKISDTKQVAAWAVGHYTFSAQAENLSFAGFHSLVADELVELSTHYYLDL